MGLSLWKIDVQSIFNKGASKWATAPVPEKKATSSSHRGIIYSWGTSKTSMFLPCRCGFQSLHLSIMGGVPGAGKTRPDALPRKPHPPITHSESSGKEPFHSQLNVLATDCRVTTVKFLFIGGTNEQQKLPPKYYQLPSQPSAKLAKL